MSQTKDDVKEQVLLDNAESDLGDEVDDHKNQNHGESSLEKLKDSPEDNENAMPSEQQEEEVIKKKYGGLLPKKPPLISKDHERAFFDSADWALGKQGAQKPKGPLEALRPKLQPTPHQQVRSRRFAYAHADDGEVDDGIHDSTSSGDQSSNIDGHTSNSCNTVAAGQSCDEAKTLES
ncbi:hypothetical protein SLEP1_g12368 [Rubroshorea leprosula]|uniref:Endosulphine n=1 Tax=Rubroshorea leprosula TaxID=152421 RepID=A0AAV5II70_9ROSI|nr:hypothetical protein SLEP1_g12368 [Rubroshorea leprosula]